MKSEKVYPAKVLLFGEYTVIHGSQALAMPTAHFSGRWLEQGAIAPETKQMYLNFADYLAQEKLLNLAQADTFRQAIEQGAHFDSDIPQGYGLGSSGALCAALYDQFFTASPSQSLPIVQSILAQIESFFHGASSGIDPLICWLNQALLIEQKIPKVVEVDLAKGKTAIFLLDTGMTRKTAPLVEKYLEFYAEAHYAKACQEQLSPLNEAAIQAILNNDWNRLFEIIPRISAFQLEYFAAMIPAAFCGIWQEGLANGQYHLKLCGAGGGGFILGFTPDYETTKTLLAEYDLIRIV